MSHATNDYDLTAVAQRELDGYTKILSNQLREGVISLGMGLPYLHVAALELNRRRDVSGALHTLDQIDHLIDGLCGDENIDWTAVKLSRTRAFGVLIDQATENEWVGCDYDRADVWEMLHGQAITEGRKRGFVHAPEREAACLIPADADAMVAPF